MKKPMKRRTTPKPAALDLADYDVYGQLKAEAHIGGYSFERAFSHMEQLLTGDRWRLGGKFDDVNGFLVSIKLDQFRHVAEQRKRIAKRIKELQPVASQRAIAKTVGANETTIRRDLGKRTAAKAAPAKESARNINPLPPARAADAAPSGAAAARMIERRSVTTEMKQERRAERERELGEKQQALPDKKYGVITADPEWNWEPWSEETGMDRAAANHYPVSALEAIKNRPVWQIAADDCVLFMWATVPMLREALEVMAAWGFEYRSSFAWVKPKPITGYWNRNKHELLLVGVKGKPPAPAPGTQWESVLEGAPVAEHSAKPESSLEMIEAYYPTLPKIELNRRGEPRAGWDAWGNEVEAAAAD